MAFTLRVLPKKPLDLLLDSVDRGEFTKNLIAFVGITVDAKDGREHGFGKPFRLMIWISADHVTPNDVLEEFVARLVECGWFGADGLPTATASGH